MGSGRSLHSRSHCKVLWRKRRSKRQQNCHAWARSWSGVSLFSIHRTHTYYVVGRMRLGRTQERPILHVLFHTLTRQWRETPASSIHRCITSVQYAPSIGSKSAFAWPMGRCKGENASRGLGRRKVYGVSQWGLELCGGCVISGLHS